MIFIIHGDDPVNTRKYLLQLKSKLNKTSLEEFQLDNSTTFEVGNFLASNSMFDIPLKVIQITKTSSKDIKDYIHTFEQHSENHFALLAPQELSQKNALFKLNHKEIKVNIVPSANIFKFIDLVYAQKPDKAYKELAKLLPTTDAMYLINMLLYMARNIAYIKFNSPLAQKISAYQKSKVSSFADNYTKAQIKELFNLFYKSDRMIKTGQITAENALFLIIEKTAHNDI